MSDWAKIALKISLIAVFTVGVFSLFVLIPFPTISLSSDIIAGISFAKSYLTYWVPNFDVILGFTMTVVAFEIGLLLFKFGVQGAKWLMKVNE